MEKFVVLVRYKDEPGAATYRAQIMAENSYQAIEHARALYGNLLLSESAMAVSAHKPPENWQSYNQFVIF